MFDDHVGVASALGFHLAGYHLELICIESAMHKIVVSSVSLLVCLDYFNFDYLSGPGGRRLL